MSVKLYLIIISVLTIFGCTAVRVQPDIRPQPATLLQTMECNRVRMSTQYLFSSIIFCTPRI